MSEPPQGQIHLVVPRTQAARWLQNQVEAGRKLNPGSFLTGSSASVSAAIHEGTQWLVVVRQMLRRIFDKPDIADQWRDLNFMMVNSAHDRATRAHLFNSYRDDYVARLAGIRKMLTYVEEAIPVPPTAPKENLPQPAGYEVFIVHGHDIAAREAVARFLMKLEIEPIILDEEPNAGRNIIEKLEEAFAEGLEGFAVVIMTPDDIGAVKDHPEAPKPRARQNVIMELGYFIGFLGRDRVCALYRAGVELPSDYHGVVYVPLDEAGAWQMGLARELKAAGFDVDLNKAL
jgi:hypothetical protein